MIVFLRPWASSVIRRNLPRSFSRNSTWKCLRSICSSLASMRLSIFLQKRRSLGQSGVKREAEFSHKTAVDDGVVNNQCREESTPARSLFWSLVCDREIDLLFKSVYSRDEHFYLVANFVATVCATAHQETLGGVKSIEIVFQSRNMH